MQEERHISPPLPLFAGHTPRLQYCSFGSFNFGWDVNMVRNLRVLKLDGYWSAAAPPTAALLTILRACPHLEELALRNLSDADADGCGPSMFGESAAMRFAQDALDDDTAFPPFAVAANVVRLPRLKKAAFCFAGAARTRALLGQLMFPALETLELAYLDNVTPLLGYVRRQALTSLPLKHLRIESCFFNELKLVRLLARLPSLTTLELVDVEDASSHLLKGLSTPPVAQSWICPRLETLNLEGCTGLDWDALRGLVEARLPAHCRSYPTRPPVPGPPSVVLRSTHLPLSISSASSSITASAHVRSLSSPPGDSLAALGWPRRVREVDVTRCHQISKEMVQWLRRCGCVVRHDATSPC